MEKKIKRVKLFPNDNLKSKNQADELEKKLILEGFVLVDDNPDLAIAIGGDGSFLRMIKNCNFNEDIYYLGINTGTLGFAQDIYPSEVDDLLKVLKEDKYKTEFIGVEEIEIETKNALSRFYSLNEILVRNKDLNTIKLNIFIDDILLENFVGDGVLISTSFGSTAYNLSFGGSIVYSDLHVMQITPVAPLNNKSYQVLRNSVIIPEERTVKILADKDSKDMIVTIDGENSIYEGVLKIEISVSKKIKCLRMNDYDYTKKINEKFL